MPRIDPLPTVVADWSRSHRERVRVTLDHDVIDIRLFFVGDPEEALRPGRTGIALPVGHLPALAAGLKEALREARVRRLVE